MSDSERDDDYEAPASEPDEDISDGDEDEGSEDEGPSRKRRGSGSKGKAPAKKGRYDHMYDEEAAEGGHEDEEDYDEEHRASAKELTEAEREAHERSRQRQEQERRMWEQNPYQILAEMDRRHGKRTPAAASSAASAGGAAAAAADDEDGGRNYGYAPAHVINNAALPGISDPKLFVIECKTGCEQMLCLSLMNKALAFQREGQPFGLMSAIAPGTKGFIYLEARDEPAVRKSINGMTKFYHSKLRMVPIRDMVSVLNVKSRPRSMPVSEGQYVRLVRPPLYRDDLARVEEVYESASRAVVTYVPRLDPSKPVVEEKRGAHRGARPPQRFFNAEEVKAAGGLVERKKLPATNEWVDWYGSDYYRGGFVIKHVNVATTLRGTNVNPTIEELQMFKSRESDRRRLALDEEEEAGGPNAVSRAQKDAEAEILEELARAAEVEGSKELAPLFVKGDAVVVIEGEMKGLYGRVEEVRMVVGEALIRIRPSAEEIANELVDLRPSQLAKHVSVGAHVRVLDGRYTGETGNVVAVKEEGGGTVAILHTDRTATEIKVRTSQLQETQEVAAGLDSLQGYELHDLVQLGPTEMAMVVTVGREELQVLNNLGQERMVRPEEVRGKKNHVSNRTVALDAENNQIRCGDVVTVLETKYARHSGTVKHIYRSVLFLHSRTHQQTHGGVFVTKARSCVLSGNNKVTQHALSNQYMGSITGGKDNIVRDVRNRFDSLLNKTVKLTKGQYKGLMGVVVEATETHVKVELSAKYKVITVERNKVKEIGDVNGAITSSSGGFGAERNTMGGYVDGMSGGATPFHVAQTPLHGAMTPMHGAQTPMHEGSMTPSHTPMTPSHTPMTPSHNAHDAWRPSVADLGLNNAQDQYGGGGSSSSGRGGGYADWDGDHSSSSAKGTAGGGGGGGSAYSNDGWGRSRSDAALGSSSSNSNAAGGRSGSGSGGASNGQADSGGMWAQRGMYVRIRSSGREGKVEGIGRESRIGGGDIVQLRMSDGITKDVSADDVAPAYVSKGMRVQVLRGRNRGETGKCRRVDGGDVMVKLDSAGGAASASVFNADDVTRIEDDGEQ